MFIFKEVKISSKIYKDYLKDDILYLKNERKYLEQKTMH